MTTVATIRTESALPAGEAKIARVSVRTWGTSPVGAVSTSVSISGPEALEERSVTEQGTSPQVDAPGYQSSERGAENLGRSFGHAHRIALDAYCFAVDSHLAQRRPEGRLQDHSTVDARADVEPHRPSVDPAQRVAERAVQRRHRAHPYARALDPLRCE